MKRILVIGLGSIGRRHLSIAKKCYPEVELLALSSRGGNHKPELELRCDFAASLTDALGYKPDMAIVASPATLHLLHAEQLLSAGVPVLLEKPLATETQEASAFVKRWCQSGKVALAYILRFSPLVNELRHMLAAGRLGRVLQVQINTGQFLPDWRPQTDYRRTVTAQKELGGGVLLELSHELDLIQWLLGKPESVCAFVANSGSLDIDVEDQVDVLLKIQRGAIVNLHIDMLQRMPRREWILTAEHGCLRVDLVAQQMQWCESVEQGWSTQSFPHERDDLFVNQLQNFSQYLTGENWRGANLDDGVAVLNYIEHIRRASEQQCWVNVDE